MKRDVLIRVDSSDLIGSGHAVRCLNLAIRLRDRGLNVVFISRENINNFNFLFIENGFETIIIPNPNLRPRNSSDVGSEYAQWLPVSQEQDAEDTKYYTETMSFHWIIIDHYALDYIWQDLLRPRADKIMVIDDLANRKHNCDLLLDQNFFTNKNERYESLVPVGCQCLLGPSYLLVSKHYERYNLVDKIRKGPISKVLVFFGSVDIAGQTELAVDAIKSLSKRHILFDVIVGKRNPRAADIKKSCAATENIRFHCQVENMADFIFGADFALGAGGATTWERVRLGLPAAVTVVADNQVEATNNAEKANAVINLGHFSGVSSQTYAEVLLAMIDSPERVRFMSDACIRLIGDSASGVVDDFIVG